MISAKKILQKCFGYDDFLPGQEAVIDSVLDGKDTLAVMPTGGGKSLCYQIPAMIFPGVAIVISPLIALMKDQVDSLVKRQIPASFINSTLDETETTLVMNEASEGKIKLLYIAPERLKSGKFLRFIGELKISFLAVDEAHCISEWGHDFRPSYLEIKKIFGIKPGLHVVALTATATPDVCRDIISQLGIRNVNQIIRGFNRPNLAFKTELCKDKIQRVQDIIKQSPSGSHIIYCGSRKKVDKTAMKLRNVGLKVLSYHAGYDDKYRRQVQEEFFGKQNAIIVATNAFGLGIDKPNVRRVIHLDLTSTLEAYYQEAGRAGRDGNASSCYILYSPADRHLQQFFIDCSYPQKEDCYSVYNYLCEQNGKIADMDEQNVTRFSPEKIAENLNLPLSKVSSIMKMLESKEVFSWKYGTNAELQFLVSYDLARECLEIFDGKLKNTLEILLRYFGAAPFREPVNFDLNELTTKYNLNRNVLLPVLKQLVFKGIISFSEDRNAGNIALNSPAARLQDYGVDFVQIDARREFAYEKLRIVENFVFTRECKRNFILNYFGETDFDDCCGKCSSCCKENTNLPLPKSKTDEKDISLLVNVVDRFNGEFAKSVLIDFLVGNSTRATTFLHRDESEFFGIFEKRGAEYVTDLIRECVRREMIKYSDEKYHQLIVVKKTGTP